MKKGKGGQCQSMYVLYARIWMRKVNRYKIIEMIIHRLNAVQLNCLGEVLLDVGIRIYPNTEFKLLFMNNLIFSLFLVAFSCD